MSTFQLESPPYLIEQDGRDALRAQNLEINFNANERGEFQDAVEKSIHDFMTTELERILGEGDYITKQALASGYVSKLVIDTTYVSRTRYDADIAALQVRMGELEKKVNLLEIFSIKPDQEFMLENLGLAFERYKMHVQKKKDRGQEVRFEWDSTGRIVYHNNTEKRLHKVRNIEVHAPDPRRLMLLYTLRHTTPLDSTFEPQFEYVFGLTVSNALQIPCKPTILSLLLWLDPLTNNGAAAYPEVIELMIYHGWYVSTKGLGGKCT